MTYDYLSAIVRHKEMISPSMIRIILKDGDLHRFESTGYGDEFIWLSFPVAGSTDEKGRYYTVRNWCHERKELTVDFVKHETGIATHWAQQVDVGDNIRLLNPRSRFAPPAKTDYIILIADITGLPAVGRVLEGLPQGFKAIVHVEVPCEADKQEIATQADVHIVWHCCHGLRDDREGYTELPRIAAEIKELPEGLGYIYIAGEARAASACRKHFRDVLGFDKKRIDAVGYWIEGQARV